MSLNHIAYSKEYSSPYLNTGSEYAAGFISDFRLVVMDERLITLQDVGGAGRFSFFDGERFKTKTDVNTEIIDIENEFYQAETIYDVFLGADSEQFQVVPWNGRMRDIIIINYLGIYMHPETNNIYLGSFYISNVNDEKKVKMDEKSKHVYSQYNKQLQTVRAEVRAPHIYNSVDEWRVFNDSDETKISFLLGDEQTVQYSYGCEFASNQPNPQTGSVALGVDRIGVLNVISPINKMVTMLPDVTYCSKTYNEVSVEGLHECSLMEKRLNNYPLSIDYNEGYCCAVINI